MHTFTKNINGKDKHMHFQLQWYLRVQQNATRHITAPLPWHKESTTAWFDFRDQ